MEKEVGNGWRTKCPTQSLHHISICGFSPALSFFLPQVGTVEKEESCTTGTGEDSDREGGQRSGRRRGRTTGTTTSRTRYTKTVPEQQVARLNAAYNPNTLFPQNKNRVEGEFVEEESSPEEDVESDSDEGQVEEAGRLRVTECTQWRPFVVPGFVRPGPDLVSNSPGSNWPTADVFVKVCSEMRELNDEKQPTAANQFRFSADCFSAIKQYKATWPEIWEFVHENPKKWLKAQQNHYRGSGALIDARDVFKIDGGLDHLGKNRTARGNKSKGGFSKARAGKNAGRPGKGKGLLQRRGSESSMPPTSDDELLEQNRRAPDHYDDVETSVKHVAKFVAKLPTSGRKLVSWQHATLADSVLPPLEQILNGERSSKASTLREYFESKKYETDPICRLRTRTCDVDLNPQKNRRIFSEKAASAGFPGLADLMRDDQQHSEQQQGQQQIADSDPSSTPQESGADTGGDDRSKQQEVVGQEQPKKKKKKKIVYRDLDEEDPSAKQETLSPLARATSAPNNSWPEDHDLPWYCFGMVDFLPEFHEEAVPPVLFLDVVIEVPVSERNLAFEDAAPALTEFLQENMSPAQHAVPGRRGRICRGSDFGKEVTIISTHFKPCGSGVNLGPTPSSSLSSTAEYRVVPKNTPLAPLHPPSPNRVARVDVLFDLPTFASDGLDGRVNSRRGARVHANDVVVADHTPTLEEIWADLDDDEHRHVGVLHNIMPFPGVLSEGERQIYFRLIDGEARQLAELRSEGKNFRTCLLPGSSFDSRPAPGGSSRPVEHQHSSQVAAGPRSQLVGPRGAMIIAGGAVVPLMGSPDQHPVVSSDSTSSTAAAVAQQPRILQRGRPPKGDAEERRALQREPPRTKSPAPPVIPTENEGFPSSAKNALEGPYVRGDRDPYVREDRDPTKNGAAPTYVKTVTGVDDDGFWTTREVARPAGAPPVFGRCRDAAGAEEASHARAEDAPTRTRPTHSVSGPTKNPDFSSSSSDSSESSSDSDSSGLGGAPRPTQRPPYATPSTSNGRVTWITDEYGVMREVQLPESALSPEQRATDVGGGDVDHDVPSTKRGWPTTTTDRPQERVVPALTTTQQVQTSIVDEDGVRWPVPVVSSSQHTRSSRESPAEVAGPSRRNRDTNRGDPGPREHERQAPRPRVRQPPPPRPIVDSDGCINDADRERTYRHAQQRFDYVPGDPYVGHRR